MDTLRATFPLTASQAQAVQEAYAQTQQLPVTFTLQLTPDVSMHFQLIPPGEFIMGLEPDAYARKMSWHPDDDQWPENFLLPHLVQVAVPFYLDRTAVTQAQWQAIQGTNPAHFTGNDQFPMKNVSPLEIDAYCQALSSLSGHRVRLPSEAEWEYACRAGSTTLFHFGDSLDELAQYGWYRGNSEMRAHPVGLKLPNPWGLYDMHGGIDEFCQDPAHPNSHGAPSDQSPWFQGGAMTQRIKRGGSWYDIGGYCCSQHSSSYPVDVGSEDHGLRVVVEIAAWCRPA
jgi:formylglycine-generating enzyme required for sulfatase activity